jgi:superfamily II DNA or RNA helicase
MQLRPYQEKASIETDAAWNDGARNAIAVMPTGAGKSLFSAAKAKQNTTSGTCVIAHREELTSQMALALARCEVKHRVIGPTKLVKTIVQDQLAEIGTSYFDPNAPVAVAGIDTLIRRKEQLAHWLPQVGLWIMDEAHHVLRENKWGEGVQMFPNARGLGVTATPMRADRKGLGSHAMGVFDAMVLGPTMRELINQKYLCDYMHEGQCHIYCPPSDVDLTRVDVSATTGDFVQPQLKQAVRESHIVGDIVEHYLRLARGKLGVVFATDLETASDIAARFKTAGVRAEAISGKTPHAVRVDLVRRFRRREVEVLVNVDLFGEGFDLPALEVVIFARPTQSYGLYVQMFGRVLRPAPGKLFGMVIDHVGNVLRHGGPPDIPRVWTLDNLSDRRPRAAHDDDEIPLRPCANCTRPYERFLSACPYCGHQPVPADRSAPEFVDGNLMQIDPAWIMRMHGEVRRIDGDFNDVAQAMRRAGAPEAAVRGAMKQHELRRDAQGALRASIAWWAGHQKSLGRSDEESYGRFYHSFGIDVLSAQTLGRPEAIALADRINQYIGRNGR